MGLSAIKDLFGIITDLYKYLNGKSAALQEDILAAEAAINRAYIETYDYLIHKRGKYKPNKSLAHLWSEAATAVSKTNEELGRRLINKSRFWLHPELYVEELNKEKAVPELEELIEEMKKMRERLG